MGNLSIVDKATTEDDDALCKGRTVFAENLAFYLQQTGETQKSIADIVGVSAPTVNEWMKAKKYPRPEKMDLLAKHFGITVADLVEEGSAPLDTHDNRAILAKNLVYYSQRAGLSQTDIAQRMGMPNKSTVNSWFNARYYPRIEKIEELAEILGVSITDLIANADDASIHLEDRAIMARNIKYYMDRKGITRYQLCDALGFNYSTLSCWLQGQKYPRVEKIAAMAQYFGCDKSDLIEDGRTNRTQAPVILDGDVMELLELYHKCNYEQKRSIKQMLHCFIDAK